MQFCQTKRTQLKLNMNPDKTKRGFIFIPAYKPNGYKCDQSYKPNSCLFFAINRDISFLYDSVKNEERVLPTPHIEDKGLARKDALDKQAAAKRKARDGELPDTLIPREFHLVQSKAALGLEYNKE